MEVDADGRRRVMSTPVVQGSVWETRMRVDQVKGGIKVFGLDEDDVSVAPARTESRENEEREKSTTPVKSGRTRRTWKAESFVAPIQILNGKSEQIQRSPVQVMKPKSDGNHQKVILSRSSDEGQFKSGTRVSLGRDDDDSDGENDEFFDIKEMNKPKLKPFVAEEKKTNRMITPLIKIQPQTPVKLHTTDPTAQSTKKIPSEKRDMPNKQSRLHNFSDLIMWRDIEKSAMVFTLGASIIIGSSLVTDPSTSFISAISYLCLASIAAIFLHRSIIWRGYVVDSDDDNTLKEVGEEEVLSLVRILVPYFNSFIRELNALLSGDPATTMKIAVLLFVLASWGSYVTMWNIVKFGFLGAFSVPKLWSLYCHQLTEYGKMGARRVGEALDSMPHKKTIGTAIAVLVLVISSTVGRVWTVFMLFAASRLHQQCVVRDVNGVAAAKQKWRSRS